MDGIVSAAGNRSFASSIEYPNQGRRESADASKESQKANSSVVNTSQVLKISESHRGESTVASRAVSQSSESFKANNETASVTRRSADTYSAPEELRERQTQTQIRPQDNERAEASYNAVQNSSSDNSASFLDDAIQRRLQNVRLENNRDNIGVYTASPNIKTTVTPPERGNGTSTPAVNASRDELQVGLSLGPKADSAPLLSVADKNIGSVGAVGEVPQLPTRVEGSEPRSSEDSRAPSGLSNRPQPEDLVGTNIDVKV